MLGIRIFSYIILMINLSFIKNPSENIFEVTNRVIYCILNITYMVMFSYDLIEKKK